MFLSNKYTKIYYQLINRARCRTVEGYREKHHIIPKCIGGTNDKSNLVSLTAREHFICHLLLVRMVDDVKHLTSLRFALAKFRQSNSQQCRSILNSWEFEQIRKAHSEAARISATGKKYTRTDEYRAKLSVALKGKPSLLKGRSLPESTKQKISAKHKGRVSPTAGKQLNITDESRQQRAERMKLNRQSRAGMLHSDETKSKISAANKGRPSPLKGVPAPKIVCPHCNKVIGGINNFSRWHGDNCKAKSSSSS